MIVYWYLFSPPTPPIKKKPLALRLLRPSASAGCLADNITQHLLVASSRYQTSIAELLLRSTEKTNPKAYGCHLFQLDTDAQIQQCHLSCSMQGDCFLRVSKKPSLPCCYWPRFFLHGRSPPPCFARCLQRAELGLVNIVLSSTPKLGINYVYVVLFCGHTQM